MVMRVGILGTLGTTKAAMSHPEENKSQLEELKVNIEEYSICQANAPPGYFPHFTDITKFINRKFNCIVFEYTDGTHCACSADCIGLYSEAGSVEGALSVLTKEIELQITEKHGGIYMGTSSPTFQELIFESMAADIGDLLVSKTAATVVIFPL